VRPPALLGIGLVFAMRKRIVSASHKPVERGAHSLLRRLALK
jgi:hypothetical protein